MAIVDGGRSSVSRYTRPLKVLVGALALGATVLVGHQVASAQVVPGPNLSPWSSTTSLPQARSRNGAVYANGYMYDIGGVDTSGNTINTSYYAPVNANGTIGSWNTTTPLPGNRRTVRPVAYNGYLYYTGGNDGVDFHNEVYYAQINANGTIGAWNTTTPLPLTQTSHSTIAYNGYLYIVGGNTGTTCTNVVRYAPINANGTLGAWSTTSSLPASRCGNVEDVTIANGYMYEVGGYDNNNVTSAVYYARVNDNGTLAGWQTNATSLATAREYNGLETMNGYLYAIGGQAGVSGSTTTSVEVATINADGSVGAWSSTAALPGPRGELATEQVNGRLYVLGGGTGMSGGSPQANVYFTSPATSSDPTPPTVSITAPNNGANVSGTININANAADNVGVVGVQFLLDGSPIGAEDTASPYSLSWNSTSASNGAHVVTARARDAAGNQTTSAGVSITVNNVAGPGPLVAYGMSENAGGTTADSSANGNTATLTSTTWTATGRYGSALVFNGTASRARANTDITLGTAWTMEAWVNNPTTTAYETIMTVGSNRDLYLASGALTLWTGTTDVTFGTVPNGSFQHIAVTYDGTNLRAYLNGTQLGNTVAATLASQAGSLQIGAYIYNGGNADYFSGTVDEVRVYNRALNAGEVSSDMNTPINVVADTTPPVLSGGAPSGTLAPGTTQATLQVTTNEAATCRYSTTANTAFASMANTFSTTGATSHATIVTGLTNGSSYNFYVRCRDVASNANTSDYPISFAVSAPDSVPPTVTLANPGTPLSGTVTLTATAADNVGVAGVQFFVDNAAIGSEDTSSPYSISWNTSTVTNASHALTAIARDAAGNVTTSNTVNVTVNNTLAGPVLAYGLNENTGSTTADSSGGANTATLTSTSWAATGRYGAALTFDGNASRVRANANVTLGAAWTVEAWVNNPNNSTYETILTLGSNRDLYLTNGVLTFWTGTNDITFGTIPAGSFQHVALTYDGTTLRAYLNGAQLGAASTVTLASQTGAFQLGAYIYNSGNVDFFSGTIDEVRVYSRALTAAQITTDMNTAI